MRIGDAAAAAGTTPRALRLPAFGVPPACAGSTGIVQRRIAALDAEITRLTRLRDQLAAQVMASSRVA
jgi:MerR family copper efflux transcriptional regulator